MLAKHVSASGRTSDFRGLAAYVMDVADERESLEPASWEVEQSDRLAWAKTTNCIGDSVGEAISGIVQDHRQIDGIDSRKAYHLVVSFPVGEEPKRWHLDEIEDRLVTALGLSGQPRISGAHADTDNAHMHIAISLVDLASGKVLRPVQDHFRLQQACEEIENDFDLTREEHTTGPEEATAKREEGKGPKKDSSFLQWVKETAVPNLLAACEAGHGWQALHGAAEKHGLKFEPRRQGVVILNVNDRRQVVKGSAADAGLSFGVLRRKLGPFEAKAEQTGPRSQDRPSGVHETGQARPQPERFQKAREHSSLWSDFQKDKDAAERKRRYEQAALKPKHDRYTQELSAYFKQRLHRERLTMTFGALRREAFDQILAEREQAHRERRASEFEERKQVREATPIPTWQTWLEQKATDGDVAALKELRKRQDRVAKLQADLITAHGREGVQDVIKASLRPKVGKKGEVVYATPNGGAVVDEADHVRVTQSSEASALLALKIAKERYGEKPLTVRGSSDFRDTVADVAGRHRLDVTFSDSQMERARLVAERTIDREAGAERRASTRGTTARHQERSS